MAIADVVCVNPACHHSVFRRGFAVNPEVKVHRNRTITIDPAHPTISSLKDRLVQCHTCAEWSCVVITIDPGYTGPIYDDPNVHSALARDNHLLPPPVKFPFAPGVVLPPFVPRVRTFSPPSIHPTQAIDSRATAHAGHAALTPEEVHAKLRHYLEYAIAILPQGSLNLLPEAKRRALEVLLHSY